VRLGNTDVRFCSAEDLLVHKLFAGRPRDIEDALSVLAKNAGLDLGYVRARLRDFSAAIDADLTERLEALLAQLKR
jgi:hypothetical protein